VDDLEARQQSLDSVDVQGTLHDLLAADAERDAITVFEKDAKRELHAFASTSTEEPAETMNLAREDGGW
jgi:hypothetical protein